MTFLATSGVATLGGRARRFEAPILPIAVFWAPTKGTPARRAWLPSVPRAVTGRRVLAVLQTVWLAGSLLILSTAADVLAAPITGSNQAEPVAGTGQPPSTGETPVDGDFVIEFIVTPATFENPGDTTLNLVKSGALVACINLTSRDVITRGYYPTSDDFAPVSPSEILGMTSGHTGEFLYVTETRIIFKPHEPNTFTDRRECFKINEFEGCFVPYFDYCDFIVREGGTGRVSETTLLEGFSFDHAALRQLRIRLALNQPEAPLITAADITLAAVVEAAALGPSVSQATGPPDGGPPPPPLTDPGGVGGGDDSVAVPNVIGLTEDAARTLIVAAGLTGGVNVQTASVEATVSTECVPGTVIEQSTTVLVGAAVELTLCPPAAAIPEPSSLALFATGLGLLIVLTWWRRRST